MGVMILAKGINPVVEYSNDKFKQLQNRIVLDNYPLKYFEMYERFDSLTADELKDWKKTIDTQVNKLLFIEDRKEFTPTQLKKMYSQISQLYIAYTDISKMFRYIVNVMYYCIENKQNLVFIKRPD